MEEKTIPTGDSSQKSPGHCATDASFHTALPAAQLNWPAMVMEVERFIVPVELLTLTISLEAGTPAGVQLVELNQSLLAEPFQVRLVCATAKFAPTTQTNQNAEYARVATPGEKQKTASRFIGESVNARF
jgi:hypothetical protein